MSENPTPQKTTSAKVGAIIALMVFATGAASVLIIQRLTEFIQQATRC